MTLDFALAIAADHYRKGFTPRYATERIEQIRDLLRQYRPDYSERWIAACIPAYAESDRALYSVADHRNLLADPIGDYDRDHDLSDNPD